MKDSIFVNCWKCGKKFDITCADKCFEHLNDHISGENLEKARFTTKCSHCGACICHKYDKMKPICDTLKQNPRIKKSGIMGVMPSVHKKHCEEVA